MTPFAEVLLDTGFKVYNTEGGPAYSTTVITVESGFEKRNKNWENSRGTWDYGDRKVISKELHSLRNFHRARRGMFQGFRFRDWGDYQATAEPITEYNMVSQGILLPAGDSTTVARLYKKTWDTETNLSDTFELRLIAKPSITNQPTIFKNGDQLTEIDDYAIDLSTGSVTFVSAFDPDNDVLTWDGEFDTPVRFGTDQFKYRFIAGEPSFTDPNAFTETYFYILPLPIVEIRVL